MPGDGVTRRRGDGHGREGRRAADLGLQRVPLGVGFGTLRETARQVLPCLLRHALPGQQGRDRRLGRKGCVIQRDVSQLLRLGRVRQMRGLVGRLRQRPTRARLGQRLFQIRRQRRRVRMADEPCVGVLQRP